MREVPRHSFVPAGVRSRAYEPRPLPIGEGQTISQPYIVAYMTEALALTSRDRVLEVGTGSGYLTALLSHRAAHVFSVEINPQLAAFGRANLERHGAENVTLETGDAARGWPGHAPYDVIVLTGSTPILPGAFVEQLAPGGRLFAVVGEPPVMAARIVAAAAPGAWRSIDLFETVIAPLVNAEHPSRFRF
jgi:protein-L-isoaspartate(D-aspartate) O-methyltransferase